MPSLAQPESDLRTGDSATTTLGGPDPRYWCSMASWPPPQPQRPQISHVPYLPGLDGLRALAVIAVMLYHANHEWLGGGFLGVEVFFVISGYLITLLLIAEHERTGKVRLGQFWRRRARRLLPALFVMMGLLALYLALFNTRPQGRTRGDFLGGILYGSNWYQIAVGQGYTASEAFAPLRHLWSLAVEEQFYLLWPLVMVVLLRHGRGRLPQVALWLIGISAAIALAVGLLFVGGDVAAECDPRATSGYWTVFGRCISVNDTLYLGSFSRAGGLLLGAAFAMVFRPIALLRGPMRRKGHLLDFFAIAGLVALGLMMWNLKLSGSGQRFGIRFDPWLFRGGFFLTGIATLSVISAVVHRGAFAGKLIGNPVLRWIGARSYGLYLFHWPIYQVIRQFAGVGLTVTQFVLAMAFTVPITELSYRLIEMPIRQRRFAQAWRGDRRSQEVTARRRQRRLVLLVAGAASMLGFAGVSIAVAHNVCVGDVECSLQAASQPRATVRRAIQTAATTPTSSTSTTRARTTTTITTATTTATGAGPVRTPAIPASPTAAPTTTPSPINTPPPTTLAAPTTAAAPTATAGPPATVAPTPTPTSALVLAPDGVVPIALGESVMLGALADLQAAGLAVDALKGRQGPDMAALVESLRANNQLGSVIVIQIGTNGTVSDADFARIMAQLPPDRTPTVVFLTVRTPRSWIAGNNDIIRALPGRYPNVRVLDWEAASQSITLCSDGTHIACGAGMARFYSNLIFDAIGRPDLKQR